MYSTCIIRNFEMAKANVFPNSLILASVYYRGVAVM